MNFTHIDTNLNSHVTLFFTFPSITKIAFNKCKPITDLSGLFYYFIISYPTFTIYLVVDVLFYNISFNCNFRNYFWNLHFLSFLLKSKHSFNIFNFVHLIFKLLWNWASFLKNNPSTYNLKFRKEEKYVLPFSIWWMNWK